jgi:protocatechuate 3,4-dioxygenase beta subunit
VKQAGAEGTSVLVDFGAAWCAPCRMFDAMFDAPPLRRFWAQHFVIVRLTVRDREALNNPGADQLMERWGGGRGIPYYALLDGTGQLLEARTGYPSGMADIPRFMALVARAAPASTAADRASLEAYLVAHSDGFGSIAGRVTDDRGRAVAGAVVAIVSRAWTHGAWRRVMGPRATTDSAGRYVIDSVSAGSYPLVVTSASQAGGAQPAAAPLPPTFFPSAPRLAGARPVPVARGQGITNVDLTTARITAVSLQGVVRSASGAPASGAAVTLTNVDWPPYVVGTITDAAGRFSVREAWPGRYTMAARVALDGASSRPRFEFGVRDVRLSVNPPPSVEIVTAPPGALAGIVRFEGAPPMTAADRGAIRVAAVPVDVPVGVARGTMRTAVDSTGAFRLDGLHGRHAIRVEGLPAGWLLASVAREGVEMADAALDIPGGRTLAGVDVLATTRGGSLQGRVLDAAGRPVAGGAAIVFAADASRWTYPSRFVRSAPIQPDGTFRAPALPAGDYLVTRVATVTSGWDAPDSLEPLQSGAVAVRLVTGQLRTLTLTAAR